MNGAAALNAQQPEENKSAEISAKLEKPVVYVPQEEEYTYVSHYRSSPRRRGYAGTLFIQLVITAAAGAAIWAASAIWGGQVSETCERLIGLFR